jgi:glutathione S-transferase
MAQPFDLAEHYGGGRFIPADVKARAKMYEWIFFLVTEIEQPLWRMTLHTIIYPEADRSEKEVALAEADCRRMLMPLEAKLADREWLAGDEPSVADFIAAHTLDWADARGLLDTSPASKAFVARMYARPAAPPTSQEAFTALSAQVAPSRLRRTP